LGEEEMMIVGTVQQEEDYSWQDACKSWAEQEGEMVAGVHQVRAGQGAAETEAGMGKEAARQSSGASDEAQQLDDLLLDGEEQEYFLKLLMRRTSPERPEAGQPAGSAEDSKNEAASGRSQEKRRSKKKEKRALKKSKAAKEASKQGGAKGTTGPTDNTVRPSAPDLLNNPEAKGRGLAANNRENEEQVAESQTTSRGECSGQKTPES
jgi:hypothetical protein